MSESQDEGPLLYTLRQLHENTAGVMETINAQERPAVITLRGRFIARIEPLACIENLEGKGIGEAVASGAIDLDVAGDKIYTSEEMLEALFGENAERVKQSVERGEEDLAQGNTRTLAELLNDDSDDDSAT